MVPRGHSYRDALPWCVNGQDQTVELGSHPGPVAHPPRDAVVRGWGAVVPRSEQLCCGAEFASREDGVAFAEDSGAEAAGLWRRDVPAGRAGDRTGASRVPDDADPWAGRVRPGLFSKVQQEAAQALKVCEIVAGLRR